MAGAAVTVDQAIKEIGKERPIPKANPKVPQPVVAPNIKNIRNDFVPPNQDPPLLSPTIADAPFDANQAKVHQMAWANHFGLPVNYKNSMGMELVLIPPGEFTMGSSKSDKDSQADEHPERRIKITEGCWMGAFEVTNSQYARVMGMPPVAANDERIAVGNTSWDDASDFCARLSATPQEEQAGIVYRLPTEAEWEYACRAGTNQAYFWGDDGTRNSEFALSDQPAIVGQRAANHWGLYDIQGNLTEWCSDWYGPYASGESVDPTGPSSGTHRVHRGSSWGEKELNLAFYCRSATRRNFVQNQKYPTVGFRVVGTLKAGKSEVPPVVPPASTVDEPDSEQVVSLGTFQKSGSLWIKLTSARIDYVELKSLFGDTSKTTEKSLLCTFHVRNTDERKIYTFHDGRFGSNHFFMKDDVGNTIRRVSMGSSEIANAIPSSHDIQPSEEATIIRAFKIPPPKTEHLVLSVDLAAFSGSGQAHFKLKASEIRGFPPSKP